MYKFDVKYTFDNYLEYYKFVLIKQRIYRDLIFALFFIGIAIYWWIDTSENTANNFLPIFAIAMGILFPLMNFITLPMLKKQLRARQDEIDRTHIVVTFNDDEVVYENLTVKPEQKVTPVVEEEAPVEEVATEETPVEETPVEETPVEETPVEETTAEETTVVEETPSAEKEEIDNTTVEKQKPEEERVFKLNYQNFLSVKETKNLFLFYLDRQTVIILPKETYVTVGELDEFKNYILTKINPRRVKFLKK